MTKRKCVRCDNFFIPTAKNQQICSEKHYKKCENCDSLFLWHKRNKTCSKKCTGQLRWKKRRSDEKIHLKKCSYCGDTFYGANDNQVYCNKNHEIKCASCNKNFVIPKNKLNRPPKTCSSSCSTSLGHTENSKLKRRNNNIEKYGVEYTFQRDDIKAKIELNQNVLNNRIGGESFKNNLKNKYGVNNISQCIKEHLLGENNPMHRPEVKESMRLTNIERYGFPTILNTPEVKEKAQESIKNSYKTSRISSINLEIAKKISEQLKVKIEFEKRIESFYYDLFIEDYKILIDINPTISHNSTKSYSCAMYKCSIPCTNKKHRNIEKDYHQKRFINSILNGKILFSLFDFNSEDELIKYIKQIVDNNEKLESQQLNGIDKIIVDGNNFKNLYENYKVITSLSHNISHIEVIKTGALHRMLNRVENFSAPDEETLDVYDCGIIQIHFYK